MLLSEIAGRSIGILGAGREGQAALRWLRTYFPETRISIYDEGPASEAQGALLRDPQVRLVNGPFNVQNLAQHQLLIRSPGISPYRNDLLELKERGVQFSTASSLWFSQHPNAKTICITGTKGKSTTAAIVTHLLRQAGLKVQLAGNIGKPLLDCDEDADWWVIELSSYQLVDLEARPTIAALLNLTDEHLDWHGGSVAYRQDKLRLENLAEDSMLVTNFNDELLSKSFQGRKNLSWFGQEAGYHVREDSIFYGARDLGKIPGELLRGTHNLNNLAAALTIMKLTGVVIEQPGPALESFRSLPHRLQSLGERNGMHFINDSLSTTPVATLAALEAFKGENVILIVGGLDRGVDWRPYIPQMKEVTPKAIICLPDSGSDIARVMAEEDLNPVSGIECAKDLVNAMEKVGAVSRPGDTVILSPGAPSFPQFRDYEERGDEFARIAGF